MRITDSRGEEGVGEFLDLGGRGAVGQVVGDGLDRLAAVEVGGVGGDRALDLERGQQRRAGPLVAEAARRSPRGQGRPPRRLPAKPRAGSRW